MKRIIILTCAILCMVSCRWHKDASDTIFKEYKPSALLTKYEAFKNLSASIDEKRATLEAYKEELRDYQPYSQAYELRRTEMLGIVAMHNRLASQYNSQMAKANYAFCNKGRMPESNMEPLPREYKPYILSLK